MELVDLKAEHALAMRDIIDIHAGMNFTPELAAEVETLGGWALLDGDDILAIGGVLPYWSGNGLGWMWLARPWRKKARAVTEIVRDVLDRSDFKRIEIGVLVGFDRGCRWAERLGFYLETPLARSWGPDGRDYSIYARVR